MKTKEAVKTEVENVIRNIGIITRHLWDLYDNDPRSTDLYMLNLIDESLKPLTFLLKKLEEEKP